MINMIILVVFALIEFSRWIFSNFYWHHRKLRNKQRNYLTKGRTSAVNLRSQAEHDADHLRVFAERESKGST